MHTRSDAGSVWTGRTDDEQAPVDDGPEDNWGGF
jgi:hypothetical protein